MSGPLNVQINWPNFPTSQPTDKDGKLTNEWQQMLQQMVSYGQTYLSGEGFCMPQQTTTNITQLTVSANPMNKVPNGTIWYNTDTNTLQAFINGEVKTITVS